MQLHCRYCAAEIPAANINLDNLVAKCANCNAVYSIAEEVGVSSGTREKATAAPFMRPEVPMPSSVQMEESFDALTIRRRWFSSQTIGLTLFAVVWNGIILFMFLSMNSPGVRISGDPFLGVGLFGLIGIAVLYFTIVSYVNSTTISVSNQTLSIQHGPLPTFSQNKEYPSADIAQLFCMQKISRGSKGSTTIFYELYAILRDQRRELLIGSMYDAQQALYLEQEIERYLRIENVPVQGEMGTY
jgi:hypothetical protein